MATKVLVPLLGEGVEEVTVIKWLKTGRRHRQRVGAFARSQHGQSGYRNSCARIRDGVKDRRTRRCCPRRSARYWRSSASREKVLTFQMLQVTKQSAISAQPAVVISQPIIEDKEIGFISPIVAKIAAEHGVNLSQVQGTGLNGRITKNDVMAFVENREFGKRCTCSKSCKFMPLIGDQLIKHTVIRKQIAEHMVMSKHTSPHVLTVMEAEMSKVIAHQSANMDIFARDGINLTLTAYFMMAIVAGLKAYPMTNSSWTGRRRSCS